MGIKWIGQHIWDFTSRFRSDVYLEGISTSTETDMLVVDSDNKVSKRAIDAITVDVSDFMANGSDNRVVTATGTDAMNAEANLTFDGTDLLIAGTGKLYLNDAGGEHLSGDGTDMTIHSGGAVKIDGTTTTSPIQFLQGGAVISQFEGHHNETFFRIYENVGASVNDYFVISVGAAGATKIQTSDQAGADGHLTFAIDGDTYFGSAAGSGKDVYLYTAGTAAHVGLHWDADANTEGTLYGGVNNHGVDFKFFGESNGAYCEWDMSADAFNVFGNVNFGNAPVVLDGNRDITPSSDGKALHIDTHTVTDTDTSTSGTVARYNHVNIEGPTLAATNSSVTTSAASTLYIKDAPSAGTNQTLTTTYALFVDDGSSRFDGNILTSGELKFGAAAGSATNDVYLYGAGAAAHVGLHWDVDGNTEGTLYGGVDNHGVDFKFFGETSGKYVEWDQSADKLTVAGTLTVDGDIILDDGGSIKEAGGTAAITVDGSGEVTKIGQDTPSDTQVLTWDNSNTKVVWSDAAGGTERWSVTIGGTQNLANNSYYYMTHYPDNYFWSNYDTSPTTITAQDASAACFNSPANGKITKINCTFYNANTDAFKIYVYKGAVSDDDSSVSLTLIATSDSSALTTALRAGSISTAITSSNTFSAGESLWCMVKKDSHSATTSARFSITLSGEYT